MIIGGYLGAGKTTLLGTVSNILIKKGLKVGVITNDLAKGLVDTYVLSHTGLDVLEVTGSCFCCNFDGLLEALQYLRDKIQCDIIMAEPVGSCTDLSATLMQPIKLYYSEYFALYPLSVLIDPSHLEMLFADNKLLKSGPGYIFYKQMEEADHLIINKVDQLSPQRKQNIKMIMEKSFPNHRLWQVSSLYGQGIKTWLDAISTDSSNGNRIANIDYSIYAEGEMQMGWYHASFIVTHDQSMYIHWKQFIGRFMLLLQVQFKDQGIVTNHVKSFLKSGLSVLRANYTRTIGPISVIGDSFSGSRARLVLNIRAEVSPEKLEALVLDTISVYQELQFKFKINESTCLKPQRPKPSYRVNRIV